MKGKFKFLVALFCSATTIGMPMSALAAGAPNPPSGLAIGLGSPPPPPTPIEPPGNEGLLSGMTPGSYSIPSGWSLVVKQDFEGSQPGNENWGSFDGDVTSTRPHSGSRSIEGTYRNDQADAHWSLAPGNIGSFNEVYLSFYEYVDTAAVFNDEFFLAKFSVSGPTYQEVLADWFWAEKSGSLAYNGTEATLYVLPQGSRSARLAGKTATIPKGSWVQWEMHYRPNTGGNSNGFYRIYRNGVLYTSVENANLNASVSMADCLVQVGGVYTRLVWMTDYPNCSSCSSAPGEGTDYCTGYKGWVGQSFSSPVCGPSQASFKRYFDDIIVLKR